MSTTTITRSKRFDAGLVRELFKKAGEKSIDPSPAFFGDQKNILLVARTDGVLSGFAYAYVLQSPDSPHPKIFLYSIDVFEGFRRQDIAVKLVGQLKKLGSIYDCDEMFVPTLKSNVAAVNLYRKTGGKIENSDDVFFVYDRRAMTS